MLFYSESPIAPPPKGACYCDLDEAACRAAEHPACLQPHKHSCRVTLTIALAVLVFLFAICIPWSWL